MVTTNQKSITDTHTKKNKEKNEILPFATTWMDLGIVLSEVSQREKDKY